jgi:glycosyltransferase involved in cell wall biosynthesis
VKKICVCSVQFPFVRGGAEFLADSLVSELRKREYDVDLIALPLSTEPLEEVVKSALAWRLTDLYRADLVIATKFPSYMIPHRNKKIWLVHQLRGAYNLYGSVYSGFTNTPRDHRLREQLIEMDEVAFTEAQQIFSISKTVSARLKHYNNFDSTALYPPLSDVADFHYTSTDNYILSVSRLEADKRVRLLIDAMQFVPPAYRAIIVGDGSQKIELERQAFRAGLQDRIRFTGKIPREEVIDLYSRAGIVFYGPIDEDYGFATIEAFASRKAVVTCSDSGGILEFVDETTGWIVEPEPEKIAEAVTRALRDQDAARSRGEAGNKRIGSLNWDFVLDALLS